MGQDRLGGLLRAVRVDIVAMLAHHRAGMRIGRVPDQRADAGRKHLDSTTVQPCFE